ncbi:subtilisin-like protein [Lentithecium fluviatile CBS 122367]|uniref:Subtilisin-like protein n=1 Tax=Lentithecium fluviatile CBS 122367 TaxID=1168545 RepID=A0A6G1IIL0_9PLEO|nr:subtilisin-like protein [Lentithecium fluviatile CBS 122367]
MSQAKGGKFGGKEQNPSAKLDNATYQKLSETVSGFKGHDLEELAVLIMGISITELKEEKSTGPHDGIKLFLLGAPVESKEQKESRIDDCLRWYLLLRLVDLDRGHDSAKEARVNLSKILLEQKPYLAFENPYVGGKDGVHWKQCTGSKMHKSSKEMQKTPFRVAAKCGNSAVIAAMISTGRSFYERNQPVDERSRRTEYLGPDEQYWPLFKILQQYEPGKTSGETALLLAAKATSGSLETLEELLKVDGIVSVEEKGQKKHDETFKYAIEEGLPDVVEKFLNRPELVADFVTSENILLALEKLQSDDCTDRSRIAEYLVAKAEGENTVNRTVVEKIITAGFTKIWAATPQNILAPGLKDCLLHLAVWHQKYEFVKQFLDDPGSVKRKKAIIEGEDERYPLWYNNHSKKLSNREESDQPDARKTRSKIRSKIVNKMIHEVSEIETLTDIFYSSDETVGDLCFDMSAFNSASYRVSEFVDSLIWQSRKQKLLSYEKTLRYAEFPSLDMLVEERETFTESSHLKREHTEVFRILDWLKEKGVKTIIKLKVPDRLINPHDDIRMAELVDNLKVKILDWKVLDLSISVLEKETKDRLEELHLYSSGNRAVISHWFSDEGIYSLKNLKSLEIKIIQETCTSERRRALVQEIRSERAKFYSKKASPRANIGKIESIAWYATPKLADLRQIAHRVAPRLARWLLELSSIVMERKSREPHYQPTKVAILDNGILSISPVSHDSAEDPAAEAKATLAHDGTNGHGNTANAPGGGVPGSLADAAEEAEHSDGSKSLWTRIEEGRSFVDGDSRLSPWLFASNPHGTQMANLICAIDPYCQLFVARVAEDTMGITSKRVEQAIAWARTKKVDVISMSFIIGEYTESLRDEIEAASKEGIVMTCSAHDEGSRIQEAYPASYYAPDRSIIRFAACDEYGKILREDKKDGYDYLIRGQNVAAGVIPFLKSEDTITGSSVSTAIAAGLSSLILTCNRLNHLEGLRKRGIDRYKLVKERLGKMAEGRDKFVSLENFKSICDLLTEGH